MILVTLGSSPFPMVINLTRDISNLHNVFIGTENTSPPRPATLGHASLRRRQNKMIEREERGPSKDYYVNDNLQRFSSPLGLP